MGNPKILVIEDEVIVARDIKVQLEGMGYTLVGHAIAGEEAVAMTRALRPDLVLMDIQLAGSMDGVVAAQAIRDQFFIPVVFLSAFAADEIIARAKLTEPYGYILKPFSDRELHTVIEMALYKHQAETRLRDSAHQLRALSQRVLQVQESERRRVAVELHDEVGQSLTALKINLLGQPRFREQTPEATHAENLAIVEDTLQQVRRLALALRPSMLDDLGLMPALQWMAEQSSMRSGFAAQVQATDALASQRFSPELEVACFRIAQEALTNISRHARAGQVLITLSQEDDALVMTVQDDGCGFDFEAMRVSAVHGKSLGLLGMQERALLVNAQLEIASTPGTGSRVRLRCPWHTQAMES